MMRSQKRNFVRGMCVLGFMAIAYSSNLAAGALGDKPKEESAPKVGEQPNSVVDDGTNKELVPPASQPGRSIGSIGDQVEELDPDFGRKGGNRVPGGPDRFDRTELKFSFARMREDGVPLYKVDELGPEGSHAPGLKLGEEYTIEEMGL